MNPLTSLRALMADKPTTFSGSVISVSTSAITVRTKSGLKSFSIDNPEKYRAGDTVRFQGEVLLGKSISANSIPVFKV